jgi:CDP-glucose 4,6-dehydratase
MIKLAIASWGKGQYVVEQLEEQFHEAGLLKLDISKAINELKWQPKMNAQQAVSLTMDWYNQFNNKRDEIDLFTESQVKSFLNE